MKLYGWTRCERGVTLTEIMMAMATSGILLAAITSSFISQQRSYAVQNQIADMTVNARSALDRLTRDVRMAGYGLPEADWLERIDWVKDREGNPRRFLEPIEIMSGGQSPDQIILIGAFDRPIAHLSQAASVDDIQLQLDYTSSSKLDSKKRKLIYIGRNEPALITGPPDNQQPQPQIDIDTDPDQPGNQGVAWRYSRTPLLPPIESISVVTYKVVIDSRNYTTPTPVLKRDTNTGGGAQPLAEYIEAVRFSRDGDTVTITVTARTANPDPNYLHPQAKDRYRRLTLTSQVKLRGLQYE